ncbi:MAG: type II secretion system F family protein [Candidatus Micrarchaeia archaeon]
MTYMVFGTAPLPLAVAVLLPTATLATMVESRSIERASALRERSDLASALELVYMEMKYGKKSLLESIDRYADAFGTGHPGDTLKELRSRLALGQKLPEALRATSAKSSLGTMLRSMAEACSTSSSALEPFRAFSEKLRTEHRYEASRKGGSLQKYLTLGMLVSSVLPSFALFSFVGYSMLAPSMAQAFAFMLLITVLLPLAYSVIRVHVNEIYNYF